MRVRQAQEAILAVMNERAGTRSVQKPMNDSWWLTMLNLCVYCCI